MRLKSFAHKLRYQFLIKSSNSHFKFLRLSGLDLTPAFFYSVKSVFGPIFYSRSESLEYMSAERSKRTEQYLKDFTIEQLHDLLVDKTDRFLELLYTKKKDAIEYREIKIEVESIQEAIKVKRSAR